MYLEARQLASSTVVNLDEMVRYDWYVYIVRPLCVYPLADLNKLNHHTVGLVLIFDAVYRVLGVLVSAPYDIVLFGFHVVYGLMDMIDRR